MIEKVKIHYKLYETGGSSIYFTTDAILKTLKNIKMLTFIEDTNLLLLTKIIIYADKVVILKEGVISFFETFIEGAETISLICSKSGFKMKANTKTYNLTFKNNELNIKYETALDKEKGIIHTLNLVIEK